MLEGPRDQLSRAASRLAQTAGLASLELSAGVVAFAYCTVGAAVEVALREATQDCLLQLRNVSPTSLTTTQLAASAESAFVSFIDAERVRGRFDVKRAVELRQQLVQTIRGTSYLAPAPSVITTSGVPSREHFRLFFQLATDGIDPRGPGASPPLPRLIGRIDQIRGPRNDFAHECVDPINHEFVVGNAHTHAGLATRVAELQTVIRELEQLFDVLELACWSLRHVVAGHPRTSAPGHLTWWRNRLRGADAWIRTKSAR